MKRRSRRSELPGGASPASMRARLSLLIGDRRGMVVGLAVCSILSGLTEAATLALVAELASALVSGGDGKHTGHQGALSVLNFHESTGTLILIGFGLCALRLLFQLPLATFSARIAADVQARLRTELFEAFNQASWSIQSRDRDGHLQEVMTSQVMQAVSGAVGTTGLINSSFQFAVLMISAFLLNAVAAVSVGALSIAMFALLRPLRASGGRNARDLSKAQVAYAGGIAESNRVAEESHVFGAGEAQRANIHTLVMQSQDFFYRSQVLLRLVTNLYQTIIYVLLVAGIGVLYLVGGHHAGSLGGVILVLLRAGTTGQAVQGSYQSLIQALPFIERTQQTLARYRDAAERYGDAPLPEVQSIGFENVSFAYNEDTPTLTDVSFTIRAGEAIGIVGPSGAGKSTLVQLLLRLRDPVDGRYLINDEPAGSFTSVDWRKQVSYVPQDPRLLHASVADNIRFFRDIDDAEVERAARLARIHDDIMTWTNGYDAIVGPRADAVSGGQQQRICLARALAARPEMLILDEPTSALDPKSEAMIGESLHTIRANLTLFIVAHRMSTLEMCDRVMVIVDGRLVGLDTKAALHQNNDYYRNASELTVAGSAV
jgi:ABC-type multidrug transport system fused ATPase/permease subunit